MSQQELLTQVVVTLQRDQCLETRMSRRWVLGGVLLLAMCAVGCQRMARQSRGDSELEGSWEVIQVTTNGERVPANELKGLRFVFAAENLTMTGPEQGSDVMTFKLDPSQEPAAIDLTDHETTIFAIYKLDGDSLKIALRDRAAKDRARPAKFESEPGSDLSVMLLKRR